MTKRDRFEIKHEGDHNQITPKWRDLETTLADLLKAEQYVPVVECIASLDGILTKKEMSDLQRLRISRNRLTHNKQGINHIGAVDHNNWSVKEYCDLCDAFISRFKNFSADELSRARSALKNHIPSHKAAYENLVKRLREITKKDSLSDCKSELRKMAPRSFIHELHRLDSQFYEGRHKDTNWVKFESDVNKALRRLANLNKLISERQKEQQQKQKRTAKSVITPSQRTQPKVNTSRKGKIQITSPYRPKRRNRQRESGGCAFIFVLSFTAAWLLLKLGRG